MRRMTVLLTVILLGAGLWVSSKGVPALRWAEAASNVLPGGTGEEAAALELKRQQLAEKEAALGVKEQELKKLAATLDSRIAEINAARKSLDTALQKQKQAENERYKRIIKIYKGLRPEEAGKLMDKLDEKEVIEMLNQMDNRTAVKLIPYLNQPRVLKWTSENLTGK